MPPTSKQEQYRVTAIESIYKEARFMDEKMKELPELADKEAHADPEFWVGGIVPLLEYIASLKSLPATETKKAEALYEAIARIGALCFLCLEAKAEREDG